MDDNDDDHDAALLYTSSILCPRNNPKYKRHFGLKSTRHATEIPQPGLPQSVLETKLNTKSNRRRTEEEYERDEGEGDMSWWQHHQYYLCRKPRGLC